MGRKTITLDNGKLDPELQKRIDDAKAEIRAKRKNYGQKQQHGDRDKP